MPSFLLEFWKLLEGGDCIPYVVFPISLTFHDTYLSFLLLKHPFLVVERRRRWIPLSVGSKVGGTWGTQIKVVRLVLGLNEPWIPETVADR